ncbi:group II intron reverse transcriptase/maturase [Arachidicoccus ginsenosidivorans]|uniref:Group II intron reverse transcriptase/maturase n=1 Tax=Arachidicoccus ginsenosidivorans TaxID=496057 RepID=A0A5B8VQZ9_9BACT|nr:group II intron reverse transcriptase/maturase [Arachidicoccus ginsenosidivorans]QEC74017.1 group II intron reverse transcriptase/maturase [Arachidicoccus ginsenosidivorans]
MIKIPIKLQDLRRKIYIKAKAEPSHRFWGLYVHVCKFETLEEAYKLVKANGGSPGIDQISFAQVEKSNRGKFLWEIETALKDGTYRPMPNRIVEIPKAACTTRTLGIATIRDRVVQAAVKLILEPIFESDFQEGSFGYRPMRTAHEATARVGKAVISQKTRVIDLDLKGYFDTISHSILLEKIAKRVNDDQLMRLIKMMLKANGKVGVPQGSVCSPLFSNLYLTELDKMLEKAKEVSKQGQYSQLEYARFADDLVILVSYHRSADKLWEQVNRRLREELAKLKVQINEEKTKYLDLNKGDKFDFLGFEFRKIKTKTGKMGVLQLPKKASKQKLKDKLKAAFKNNVSQPLTRVRDIINPIIKGWVNHFKYGNSSKFFGELKYWLNKKIRRHLMRAMKRKGYGWKRWSTKGLFAIYNIFCDFKVVRWKVNPKRQAENPWYEIVK